MCLLDFCFENIQVHKDVVLSLILPVVLQNFHPLYYCDIVGLNFIFISSAYAPDFKNDPFPHVSTTFTSIKVTLLVKWSCLFLCFVSAIVSGKSLEVSHKFRISVMENCFPSAPKSQTLSMQDHAV